MQYQFNNTPGFAVEGLTVGPRHTRHFSLDWRSQVTAVVLTDGSPNAGEVITVTMRDNESLVEWTYTFETGASLALTLDAMLAAHRANGKANQLFAVEEDGATTFTMTSRLGNRAYLITAVASSGSLTAVATNSVEAGGSGLQPGLMCRRVGERGFDVIAADTTLAQLAGVTFDDGGRSLYNELAPSESPGRLPRGKTHDLLGWGLVWVAPETAVAMGDPVYVRRATTSGAGRPGAFRASAAGSANVLTVTPIVNQAIYGFSFRYRDRTIDALYMPTDATTSIADAIAGLLDSVNAEITAAGFASDLTAADNTTTLTITTVAGGAISEVSANVWYGDTEAATVTVSLGAVDADALDISSIAAWETPSQAGGLALLRCKLITA